MSDPLDARDMLERAEQAATAGDFVSAHELLTHASRIQEETLGPFHPDLANTFNNLAVVAEKIGNPDDAEAFYRRAVAIATASRPAEDPIVVASRENLESFCRARGVPFDAPTALPPTRDTNIGPEIPVSEQPVAVTATADPPAPSAADAAEPPPTSTVAAPSIPVSSPPVSKPIPAAPVAAKTPHSIVWVAIAIVLVLIVVLVMRPGSSRNTSAPESGDLAAPRPEAPPPAPATTELPTAPKTAPPRNTESAPDRSRGSLTLGTMTLVSAELCRNFAAKGSNWRCDPAGNSVAPGALVLYTRLRSARGDTVVHRWFRGDTLRQSARLAIGANTDQGYRTYSRQTVTPGDWRVEVRNADGRLLDERRFSVR